VLHSLRGSTRDPVAWLSAIQLLKTVVAAVVAWVLAVQVFGLAQPFLAPWAALLVVHATIYRTFSRGVRQVAATVLGVLLAAATAQTLGLNPWSLGLTLLAGLLVGQVRFLRSDSTVAAATSLFVLTTGSNQTENIMRLLDTGVGVGVGLLVNLAVWPPFQDRSATRAVDAIDDAIGALLCDMAQGLRAYPDEDEVDSWIDRTEKLDQQIDHAWGLVRLARESGRWNPRPHASQVRQPGAFGEVLDRLEQTVAATRSMAATIRHSVTNVIAWDLTFRERWIALLEEAGRAVLDSDAERVYAVHDQLRELADSLSTADLPTQHWPEYGGLIVSLRNVVVAMGVVAHDNPLRTYRLR